METEKQYFGPYKVVKIFRVFRKHQILAKNLTREEAQRLVRLFPDSNKSMVVFYKQFDSLKYYA